MGFVTGIVKPLSAFAVLVHLLAASASAQENSNPVVLELFTSQGCPGCPPADALLKRMGNREGILTLSWPIDYWDRLGWEDTLASPDNAVRQMAYNKRLGVAGVFTPEMIINGDSWLKGNDQTTLEARISEAMSADRGAVQVALIAGADGRLRIAVAGAGEARDMFVRYVWYRSEVNVDISGGVNEGRTLHYTNVVRGSEVMDDVAGTGKGSWTLQASEGKDLGADHLAILVHDGYGHGPVVAAASVKLP